MGDYHRKIELQSPEDLQYLISNVRRAAHEKLERDLPPIEGEDEMRTETTKLVHNYITTVFQKAADNITINGLPPNPALISGEQVPAREIEEFEPMDAKLDAHLRDLLRQEEALVEEIARLKREVPRRAVEQARDGYTKGIERDEQESRDYKLAIEQIHVPSLERQEGIVTNWNAAISGLQGLKSSLPETVAKKERAESAKNYVLTLKKG